MKSFLVALSLLLVFSAAHALDIPPAPSANYYLLSSHITRSIQIELDKRRAELEGARALVRRDVQLLEMYSRLRRTGSVSREEHERIHLRKKLSDARVEQLTHLITELEAAIDANKVETKLAAGEKADLKTVYNAYRAQWDAQCRRAEYDVKASEAAEKFAGFEYQVAHSLYQSRAGSLESYLEKQAAHAVAVAEDTRARNFRETCPKNLPTEESAMNIVKNAMKAAEKPTDPKE